MTNYVLIGDVHSQSDKLISAVNWVKNNINDYYIIFLGDLFDSRNNFSDSSTVYKLVRSLEKDNKAVTIQSNHQHKLLRYYRGNNVVLSNGIDRTIADFENDNEIKSSEVYSWLENLPYGVAFRDDSGVEYRAAHAFFSNEIFVPTDYEGIYKVHQVNKKIRDYSINGLYIKRNEVTERVQWWNWDKDQNIDWIRVAGHYHIIHENIETKALILDGGCGNEGGSLVAYDVNSKTLTRF